MKKTLYEVTKGAHGSLVLAGCRAKGEFREVWFTKAEKLREKLDSMTAEDAERMVEVCC
jgi:hypothetical protein